MARFHEVTVLTRSSNRKAIERGLGLLPADAPKPSFVYFDCKGSVFFVHRLLGAYRLYAMLWQLRVRSIVAREHRLHGFDLFHHVTFASFRYPSALWGHGPPVIWGPVGGIETIPLRLLPLNDWRTFLFEVLRNLSHARQESPRSVIGRRAKKAALILSSMKETQAMFARMGIKSRLFPTIGISPSLISVDPIRREGRLQLLFVGQLTAIKGVLLAIEAVARSQKDVELTFIGSGPSRKVAQERVERLGLQKRVRFLGALAQKEVFESYGQHHVFLFPTFRDSGGLAVLEAMAKGLPVICLDVGGPRLSVSDECGVRVPLGPEEKIIDGLAAAIALYHDDRDLLVRHGEAARERVASVYSWPKKGEEMNRIYSEVAGKTLSSAGV